MLRKVGWNLLKIGDDRLCLPCGAMEGKKEVRGKKRFIRSKFLQLEIVTSSLV
jgi:hypothetical protein